MQSYSEVQTEQQPMLRTCGWWSLVSIQEYSRKLYAYRGHKRILSCSNGSNTCYRILNEEDSQKHRKHR